MTCYVDPLDYWGTNKLWCHLATDGDLEELHLMAKNIGLKQEWFQDTKYPHYDLVSSKRKKAVELGAIEVSSIELIRRCKRRNNE